MELQKASTVVILYKENGHWFSVATGYEKLESRKVIMGSIPGVILVGETNDLKEATAWEKSCPRCTPINVIS